MMSEFQACSSLPPAPPPLTRVFVEHLWGGRFIKKTHAEALKSVKMPHPGTISKFHFPANKLQMPNLWESVKIWNRF